MGLVETWDRVFGFVEDTTKDDTKPWTEELYEDDQRVFLFPSQVHPMEWNPTNRTIISLASMQKLKAGIVECGGRVVNDVIIDECGNAVDGHRRRAALLSINIDRARESLPPLKMPCRVVHSRVIPPQVLFRILNSTQKPITSDCQLRLYYMARNAVTDEVRKRSELFVSNMGSDAAVEEYIAAGGDLKQRNAISKISEATGLAFWKVALWVARTGVWRKTKKVLAINTIAELRRAIERNEYPRM